MALMARTALACMRWLNVHFASAERDAVCRVRYRWTLLPRINCSAEDKNDVYVGFTWFHPLYFLYLGTNLFQSHTFRFADSKSAPRAKYEAGFEVTCHSRSCVLSRYLCVTYNFLRWYKLHLLRNTLFLKSIHKFFSDIGRDINNVNIHIYFTWWFPPNIWMILLN